MNKERFTLDGNQLKLIAVLTMLIDHGAWLFFEKITQPAWYYCLRGVGRIAFPVFCFLLVEGFFHTKSCFRYGGRLFIFALLSEIPFDLVMVGQIGSRMQQNVFFTLFLGLLMMVVLRQISWRLPVQTGEIFQLFVIFIFSCFAWMIRCDYDYTGIMLIAIFYLMRENRRGACLLGFLWMGLMALESYLDAEALQNILFIFMGYGVSFALIFCYNGKQGHFLQNRLRRYVFYWFYPVHLMILYLIGRAVGLS